jgi:hypothetical protein
MQSRAGAPPNVDYGWHAGRLNPKNWLIEIGTPSEISHADLVAIYTLLFEMWLDKNKQYPASQYGVDVDHNVVATGQGDPSGLSVCNGYFWMIPQYRKVGIDNALLNRVIDWVQTICTGTNWEPLRN